ncbi:MAG: hypothetical protein ACREUG_10920, partial [Steroidobacteraceae bacterium]
MLAGMHPILARRERLLAYLALWVTFGLLLAAVIAREEGTAIEWTLLFALPLSLFLGVQSLSLWYLVRTLPPVDTPLARLAGTWLAAGACALAIWIGVALGWARILRDASGSA